MVSHLVTAATSRLLIMWTICNNTCTRERVEQCVHELTITIRHEVTDKIHQAPRRSLSTFLVTFIVLEPKTGSLFPLIHQQDSELWSSDLEGQPSLETVCVVLGLKQGQRRSSYWGEQDSPCNSSVTSSSTRFKSWSYPFRIPVTVRVLSVRESIYPR